MLTYGRMLFYTKGESYGAVEVRFANMELTVVYATTILETEKWLLFPTYIVRKIVRMSIGRAPPEIKVEWLAAAILSNVNENIRLGQATRTQQLNWWGYNLELFLIIPERNLRYLPKVWREKDD